MRPDFDLYIAQGEENREYYELIRNHCSKARIERMAGRGLIEQQTNLPIGHFSLACEHSEGSGYAAFRLSHVAIDFYRRSCVGCEHRSPVNIPNLASVVAGLDMEEAEVQRLQEIAQGEVESGRELRRTERTKYASQLPREAMAFVELVNRLDTDAPLQKDAEELEILVRARLQEVSDEVAAILIQASKDVTSDHFMPALQTLLRARRIAFRSVEELIVDAIVSRRSTAALKVALEGDLEELLVTLASLIRVIVLGAFGATSPFERVHSVDSQSIWRRAFSLLIEHREELLLSELYRMLDATSPSARQAAAVASGIFGKAFPEKIPDLTDRLISSLATLGAPKDRRSSYDKPETRIADAIGKLLFLQPATVISIMEDRVKSLKTDQRKELFRAYGEACRSTDSTKGDLNLLLLDSCLNRLGNDWGYKVIGRARDALKALTSRAPEVLIGRTDALLAVLFKVSEPSMTSKLEGVAEHLELMAKETARTVAISGVTECLKLQANLQPEEVFRAVETLLTNREIRSDSTRLVRRSCIELIPALVDTPYFSKSLPILYTCLLGTDQSERAAAVRAWGIISQSINLLPLEISAAIPALLGDQYVVVHKAAVRAISNGLAIRDKDLIRISRMLLELCILYLKQADESHFVLDVFEALSSIWSDTLGYSNVGFEFEEVVMLLAKELPIDSLQRLIQHCSFAHCSTSGYVIALLRVLRDETTEPDFNGRYCDYREKLTKLEPQLLEPHIKTLMGLALAHVPIRTGRAFFYVELLQNLNHWDEAADLATQILSLVPMSYEYSGRRRTAREIESQAKLENAIYQEDTASVQALLQEIAEHYCEVTQDSSSDEHDQTVSRAIQLRRRMYEKFSANQASDLRADSKELDALITNWLKVTSDCWRGFNHCLLALSRLMEWKTSMREALTDSARFLSSAKVIAQEAIAGSKDHSYPKGVLSFLEFVERISEPGQVEEAVSALKAMPLPLPYDRTGTAFAASSSNLVSQDPVIFAVSEIYLDRLPAADASLLRLNRVYTLKLSLKLSEWPESYGSLNARFLRVTSYINISDFTFERPSDSNSDGLWSVTGDGDLVISASRALATDPMSFTLSLDFVGASKCPQLVGQAELRLWSFDKHLDHITGVEQLDKRIADIAREISSNSQLGDENSRRDFITFLISLTRAGVVMQRNDPFMVGDEVTEAQFQKELLKLVQMDPALGGRVHEGSEISGGETDLLYEKIVGELKVEKNTPVTVKNVSKYLGQTTSYSSGLGAQLGIACILDLSRKTAPIGAPQNYLYWLSPQIHGIEIPDYPTQIAVFVINGALPKPSSWKKPTGVLGDP